MGAANGPFTTDPNYIGEPNYVTSDAFDNWEHTGDLSGNSVIEPNDLQIFATNWLWEACWRNTSQPAEMMILYGMSAVSMESVAIEEQSPLAHLSNEELIQQASITSEVLNFIIMLIEENEIEENQSDDIVEHLADWLVDLQDEYYLRE